MKALSNQPFKICFSWFALFCFIRAVCFRLFSRRWLCMLIQEAPHTSWQLINWWLSQINLWICGPATKSSSMQSCSPWAPPRGLSHPPQPLLHPHAPGGGRLLLMPWIVSVSLAFTHPHHLHFPLNLIYITLHLKWRKQYFFFLMSFSVFPSPAHLTGMHVPLHPVADWEMDSPGCTVDTDRGGEREKQGWT